MKAAQICRYLYNAIHSGEIAHGRVQSVFRHACNIEAGKHLITLLCTNKTIQPMSVLAEDPRGEDAGFLKRGLKNGMSFSFRKSSIECPETGFNIGLEGAECWSPDAELNGPGIPDEEIGQNLRALKEELASGGRLYGMGGLLRIPEDLSALRITETDPAEPDKRFHFIRHRYIHFIRTLINGDAESSASAADSIIGFGPGLTPATDDCLCGIMLSFLYRGLSLGQDTEEIAARNRKMIVGSLRRTTRISAAMLSYAAEGMAGQSAKALLQALFAQRDSTAVISAAREVLDYGETSGTDLAIGIYTGLVIAMKRERKGRLDHACMD